MSQSKHIQKLCGPGVPDLEHCPPLTHFDLTQEEFLEFLGDPAAMLTKLGLPVPEKATITLDRAGERYSENTGWTKIKGGETSLMGGCCCCMHEGGNAICHPH